MPVTSPRNRRTARFKNPAQFTDRNPIVEMHGSRAKCKGVWPLTAANTSAIAQLDATPGLEIASGISNSLPTFSQGDGLKTIRISPLGDFPIIIGGRRYIQVVDEQAVNMMVSHFSLPAERLRQVFNNLRESWHPATGVSIYEGHIDDPAYLATYKVANTDNRALARIKKLHIHPDTGELMADIAVNTFGLALMAGEAPAYGYHSPHWRLVPAPDKGPNHVRPALLLSSALTNTPNIPDNHVSFNARFQTPAPPEPQPSPKQTMNPELLKKLNLPTDATPEQIDAAVNSLLVSVDTAEARATVLQHTLDAANTQLQAANSAATDYRKALVDHQLDQAIAAGRITPAQRPEWQSKADAAADLPAVCNTLADLSKLAPTLPTAAKYITGNLTKDGTISTTQGRVTDQIQAAVNTIMADQHVDRTTAFNIAESDPRYQHLFNS